jgi:hypothetical protein
MDQATINFLGRAILRYRQFKLTFVPQKYLITGKATSVGWANDRELRIATKRPVSTWMDVFVHETCHLDQQLQRPSWHKHKEEALGKVDDWLSGKRVDHIESYMRQVVELEWDCERPSVRTIARNKLPSLQIHIQSHRTRPFLLLAFPTTSQPYHRLGHFRNIKTLMRS